MLICESKRAHASIWVLFFFFLHSFFIHPFIRILISLYARVVDIVCVWMPRQATVCGDDNDDDDDDGDSIMTTIMETKIFRSNSDDSTNKNCLLWYSRLFGMNSMRTRERNRMAVITNKCDASLQNPRTHGLNMN